MFVQIGHVVYQSLRRMTRQTLKFKPHVCTSIQSKVMTKITLVTSDDLSRGHIAPYFRFLSITFD